MKKFVIIAGMMAMAGALFLASPVSAQDNEAITATLNDDGSVTVSGTGWEGAPAALYVTICKGADVTSDEPVSATNATQVCQDIMTDGFSTNPERGDGGTTSYTIPAAKVGEVPEAGYVVLQGEFAAGSPWSAWTILTAGGADEPEEEMEDEMEEGAGGEEEMEDMNEVDDMMDDTGTDDMEEMDDSMDDADETVMMANTGSESGLLAVIGVSILLAGLFAVGLGRRITKRS